MNPTIPSPNYMFILISVLVSIIIFLLIREFVCWYFKLNRIVQLLSKIAGEDVKIKVGSKESKIINLTK
jgi:hypothetical protein